MAIRRGHVGTLTERQPEVADLSWGGSGPDVPGLLKRMLDLRSAVAEGQRALVRSWQPLLRLRGYRASAANLAAYLVLRRHDLRSLQRFLTSLGLSSLGRCEGHVKATLDAVTCSLQRIAGKRVALRRLTGAAQAMARDQVLLKRHTVQLLGEPPAHRWTRFMVTLPTETAADYEFVRDALRAGMDLARINCAHDGPREWRAMVRNVRRAERELGRPCRVVMDLSGPKLRTGPVRAGKVIFHIRVDRDPEGRLLAPARVVLDASGSTGRAEASSPAGAPIPARIAVDAAWLERVGRGDTIQFVDLRGRARRLVVEKRLSATEVLVRSGRGAFVGEGTALEHVPRQGGVPRLKCAVGPLGAEPVDIRVQAGDVLLLTRNLQPGEPGRRGRDGKVVEPAHLACSEPGVFSALKVGHRVWIDDGKIGTTIEALDERGAWLRVTHARRGGEHVRPGKGLNFPDSELPLPALGEGDLADLDFAVRHADIIGMSFVRSADDIDLLSRELDRRARPDMGVIAKVETRAAVQNLADVIVHGAGRRPFGVMIARGDLAVEIGYERLAEVQEEILWLCEAAHVPVVWATQVLENLVKRGRPSRAEMTDAAMSERAECVMLNKGPHLFQAMQVLDEVVTRMQGLQSKKTAQFRPHFW
jgi:pyruvate kinase